jgi:hypothetical protein
LKGSNNKKMMPNTKIRREKMIILSGLFILGIGIVGGYQLATLPKLIEMKQHKAIQNHFNVKGNEYTYYQEDSENYILSLVKDTEYRIKFSKNTPLKVVFTEILEPM